MDDFTSRLVFVTGGSSGIGLAIARRFAERGASLCLFARREAVLRDAVAEVEARRRSPTQVIGWRALDVTDEQAVAAVMAACVAELGCPDVLVNCAGRARPDYFEAITAARLDETMRVNLGGTWNATAAIVPHMKRRGGGSIVNVSSVAGLIGVFGYTDYCASKFAVVGFSEALRSELEPHGITVSVLCPPDTATPGFDEENRTKPPETVAVSEGPVLAADDVAAELLRGMARRRFLIVPGRQGKIAHLVKRLWPALVEREMRRKIRRVRATTSTSKSEERR